jgi:DNA-binding sugar fermentation-stimulating protein
MPSIPRLPILFTIGPLYEATVLKRPSATCKTPYVADIILQNENASSPPQSIYMAHTPALGCGGLCEKTSSILVAKKDAAAVCEYTAYFAILQKQHYRVYVCIYPKLAETAVECGLRKNKFSWLQCISVSREVTHGNSRFDFAGFDTNNTPFLLEVKCVPLATDDCAYFPVGVKRKPNEIVSPRALKHIQELETIKLTQGENIRCILCFVIMRSDVNKFALNEKDPIYKEAVMHARQVGVEIRVIKLHMTREGYGYLATDNVPFV